MKNYRSLMKKIDAVVDSKQPSKPKSGLLAKQTEGAPKQKTEDQIALIANYIRTIRKHTKELRKK